MGKFRVYVNNPKMDWIPWPPQFKDLFVLFHFNYTPPHGLILETYQHPKQPDVLSSGIWHHELQVLQTLGDYLHSYSFNYELGLISPLSSTTLETF